MLKRVHSFFITVILSSFLLTPAIVIAAPDSIDVAADVSKNGDIELIQHEINVEDANIEPINTKKVKDSVIPDPSKEGKKVIGLFLKTMMAVAFCSALLYFILLFAKKYYFGSFGNSESEELENLDLSTPNNKQDALRSFLNRTK